MWYVISNLNSYKKIKKKENYLFYLSFQFDRNNLSQTEKNTQAPGYIG